MKFIIGKKIEMSQLWLGDKVVAVTKIQAGPCVAVQVKSREKDGYEAVQLGFGSRQPKNIKKPQKGHFRDLGNFQSVREFRCENTEISAGDQVKADTFAAGDKISVVGTSKGKGFQGVVKRHNFKGSKKTHGNKDQLRMPGSVGATGPAHIFKGTKMAGRMGNARHTILNLEIAGVEPGENIIYIKGAVPGARNSLVMIIGPGELIVNTDKAKQASAPAEEKLQADNTAEALAVSEETVVPEAPATTDKPSA